MAKADVEKLLTAGGKDKKIKAKYDVPATKEEFRAGR